MMNDVQSANPYASFGASIADAPADERADFIRKTYTHLTMAIFGFAAICWALFQTDLVANVAPMLFQAPLLMLAFFGCFVLVSWIAEHWARTAVSPAQQYAVSPAQQYAGLGVYVLAQSIFFCPLLWVAQHYSIELGGGTEVNVIGAAGVITLIMFGGLSAIAWFSGADFSFMRAGLTIAGFAAFGLIACSWIFRHAPGHLV